jgi:hypothetical protein
VNGVVEVTFTLADFADRFDEDGSRPHLPNPYMLDIAAHFEHEGSTTRMNGFYDGNGVFKVRFSPSIQGKWAFWTVSSTVDELHGHTGMVVVTHGTKKGCPSASPGKKGFRYPDGTLYSPVGTTCYAWVHQDEAGAGGDPDELEENTLNALKTSPFNKLRMTGFPKWYPFTHHEPRYYPFQGKFRPVPNGTDCHPPKYTACGKSEWDFTRFDPAFWKHYEKRVAAVVALGVIPEIILKHPYDADHWGFDRINRRCGIPGSTSASQCAGNPKDCLWCDENYIKYMVARLSAYGVWWSMANEFDLMKAYTTADWDQLFQSLQNADTAHNRERSIHNCVQYYNHSQPWISHVSLQGNTVSQIAMVKRAWTDVTPKPIVRDEVEYEGNITYQWGGLTGYEESRRAWTAFVLQTAMAGHSNTALPAVDAKACGRDPGQVDCNAVMVSGRSTNARTSSH